jgi:hypothetical protein
MIQSLVKILLDLPAPIFHKGLVGLHCLWIINEK